VSIDYASLIQTLDDAENALDLAQADTNDKRLMAKCRSIRRDVLAARAAIARDQCVTYEAALEAAGLRRLVATSWACGGSRCCDAPEMLRRVCTRKVDPISIADAVGCLAIGLPPKGASPLPDASAALLDIRGTFKRPKLSFDDLPPPPR